MSKEKKPRVKIIIEIEYEVNLDCYLDAETVEEAIAIDKDNDVEWSFLEVGDYKIKSWKPIKEEE